MKNEGADDVGRDEGAGAVDRAVHVGLGGEVHDPVGREIGEEVAEKGGVGCGSRVLNPNS